MSVATILNRLKAAGLAVRTEGDKVMVSPRERLSRELLELIRVNKEAILKALPAGMALDRRNETPYVIENAGPGLSDFRIALISGRLHVCCNCKQFDFASDPAGHGHCRRFGVEAAPFVPFWCSGFTPSMPLTLPGLAPSGQRTSASHSESDSECPYCQHRTGTSA